MHACFWHVCSDRSHTYSLSRYKRSEPTVLRSDVPCSFCSELVEMFLTVRLREIDSTNIWPIFFFFIFLTKTYTWFCSSIFYLLFSPVELCRQFGWDTVNMRHWCRMWQVLCLCISFTCRILSWDCLQMKKDHEGQEGYRGLMSDYVDLPVSISLHYKRGRIWMLSEWMGHLQKYFCYFEWALKHCLVKSFTDKFSFSLLYLNYF